MSYVESEVYPEWLHVLQEAKGGAKGGGIDSELNELAALRKLVGRA